MRRCILATILFALAAVALGQADLYGPEAPRDVAYLRLLGAAAERPAQAEVDGEALAVPAPGEATSYAPLPPGQHLLRVGELSLELPLEAESFVTVAVLPGELLRFDDEPLRDVSRGLLSLYNLTPGTTLSLTTADGTTVLAEVPPRSVQSLAISEAEVELVVRSDGAAVATVPARLYERGVAHGVIALPEGDGVRASYARAEATP